MSATKNIPHDSDNDVLNIALDTIKLGKQALVFVNTKRSAEKTAEDIAKKIKTESLELRNLSEDVLKVLSRPTKQCERLAFCVRKGIAFHHAGLTQKQKELIEDNFREGKVKIICCTPTLCLSKETMIWHDISETEVPKFKSSNPLFVLSKNKLISMKAQKVNRIMNSLKLIQISSVSGYSIKVTPTHKILTKRKDRKMIIPAKNINKKDKIATIGKLNIENIKIPSIKDFIVDNKADIQNCKFNPELAYFIGVILGDGYSGAETNNRNIKYKGSPTIVGIDNEIFLHVKKICDQLKLNCRETKTYHGTPSLILSKNKWFREFLVRCGVEKRDKKYISENLMMMDLENISCLLKGLFDTDGYVHKRFCIGFSNTSEKLVKQIQKSLLRFGIVSRIRKRKESSMKIYDKEYKTLPHFELTIHQKKSVLDFYRFIGFNVQRKQNDLIDLVAKICSNLNYVFCDNCGYKIYKDLFSGRTKDQKKWGQIKLKVINLLGKNKELGSRELKKILNHEPKKKDSKLNHHYQLIKKRRIGSRSNTEWFWSLNKIGEWIFKNIIKKNKKIEEFFRLRKCPLCKNEIEWIIKKGWRDSDFEGDIFWDVIREIKEVDCEKEVYDVVLPKNPKNDHMLVANGFIIHNSYGLDLPAFRSIIKDLRRYSQRGLVYIPVLEYLQMAGRAGRPKFDSFGEAIAIAKTEAEKDKIYEMYILGEPEEIYSKLAVEPVLRTYLLSLIATNFTKSKKEIMEFFNKTFWAFQFSDMDKLEGIIMKMLDLLAEWEFIIKEGDDFKRADELDDFKVKATIVGKRVAELYIDPLTAYFFICCLREASNKRLSDFSFLQMISHTLEMRPLLRLRVKEYDKVQEQLVAESDFLLEKEPSMYEPEYEEFLNSVKTGMMFHDWVSEKDEEFLLEEYNVRPGELRAKQDTANWLLHSSEELSKLLQFKSLIKEIVKLRLRMRYGVKEELLSLLRLEQIGRVRARKLYRNKIKDIADVKKVKLEILEQILGRKTALAVKKQVGEEVKEVRENKRKGQISLKDYEKIS